VDVLLRRSPQVGGPRREYSDYFGLYISLWQARLEDLSKGRLLGRCFAASRERLREVATRLGLRRVPNLCGCPAT